MFYNKQFYWKHHIQWYIDIFFLSVAFYVKPEIPAVRKQLLDNLDIAAVRELQHEDNSKAQTAINQLKAAVAYSTAFCLLCFETDGTPCGECAPHTITEQSEPFSL